MAQAALAPLLQMEGIYKSFPGVQALSGAHLPDVRSIRIGGELQAIANPVDAQRAGVAVIYQEFNLIPYRARRG